MGALQSLQDHLFMQVTVCSRNLWIYHWSSRKICYYFFWNWAILCGKDNRMLQEVLSQLWKVVTMSKGNKKWL